MAYEPQSVAGKSIVVTGGTTGIGRATARLLAEQGAKVLIFGRHEKELNEALEEITAAGEGYGLIADVARVQEIKRVFQEADARLNGLDALVNNAALAAHSVVDSEYEEWQNVVNVNVLGYMGCAREAIDRFRQKGGGHIVNVGSLSSLLREPGSDVYVATKAAIDAFSESLRKHINKEGIKITLIEPGLVATSIGEKGPEDYEQKLKEMKALEADDLAQCVLYCLTQPARCDVIKVQIRPHLQDFI